MLFDYSQYTHSSTAKKKGIDNSLTEDTREHIQELDRLLVKLSLSWAVYCERNKLGKSGIGILSGYRSELLNKEVGGSKTSAHLAGYAADIFPLNRQYKEFFKFALSWTETSKIVFDEIIVEGVGDSRWLHVGVKSYFGEQQMKTQKIEDDKLISVVMKDMTYGLAPSEEENSLMVTSNSRETEGFALDWTDEDIYEQTPEELDSIAYPAMLFSRQDEIDSSSNLTSSEKRCLYIMKELVEKIALTPKQAAGVVGNLAYMTNGTFCTYSHSSGKYGIAMWDWKYRDMFNRMHYKTCYLEESTLEMQVEFLIYTMSDRLVYKLQRCYDENSACNMFFSIYIKNTNWSDIFYGMSSKEEEMTRQEASDRRAFAGAAIVLWESASYVNVDGIKEYIGNGQDGPKMKMSDDSKIYISDGEFNPVPESEREFSREYIEDETIEDQETLEDYYSKLFQSMMGI